VSRARVTPGRRAELGLLNSVLAFVLSRGAGVREAHLFTTLGRNRGLFRAWLVFSGALMLGGKLPRRETELVILRIAHTCNSAYEWRHHVRLGRKAGLTAQEIEAVKDPAAKWRPSDEVLLAATDELLASDDVSDETWSRLRAFWDERQLIEFTLLVGQYRGLASAIRALGIQPDR